MTLADGSFFDAGVDEEESTNDYSSYWQSIPDPPTPAIAADVADNNPAVVVATTSTSVAEESRRHQLRKRNPSAFRDVTNLSNGDKHNSVLLEKASVKSNSESVTNPPKRDEEETAAGCDEVIGTAKDGSEEIVEKKRSSKRRKKRRSMLLPSDDESGAPKHPLTSCLAACVGNGDTTGMASNHDDVLEQSKPNENNSKKDDILIALVRTYCSLPIEHQVNSKEAKQIESLSGGYPMPGKVRPVMENATSKEAFLLRVQPIVQEMEDRKQEDVAETRLVTQCVVKKNHGGYFYFDVNSGEQVRPTEYKRRYAAMIDEKKRRAQKKQKRKAMKREESVNQTLSSSLLDNKEETKEIKVDYCDSNESTERCDGNSSKSNGLRSPDTDDSNMDESVNMEDDSMIMSPDDSVVVQEEDHVRQRYSIGTAASSIEVKMSTTSPTTAPDDDSLVASKDDDPPVETLQRELVNHQPSQHENNNHDSSPHHPLLLAGGNGTSNDPRVLAARRKLWRTIDTALAEYSQEIMTIEEGLDGGGGDVNLPNNN